MDEIEKRLSRSLKGFVLENPDFRQLEQTDKNLEIVLKFSNPGYGSIRGPLLLLRPRVLGEKGLVLERKPRHFPFQFEDASHETDVYEFELPKKYSVDDVPEPGRRRHGIRGLSQQNRGRQEQAAFLARVHTAASAGSA